MRKKLEKLKAKYEGYRDNLKWHIETNNPVGEPLEAINIQLDIYNQIISDLEKAMYY